MIPISKLYICPVERDQNGDSQHIFSISGYLFLSNRISHFKPSILGVPPCVETSIYPHYNYITIYHHINYIYH